MINTKWLIRQVFCVHVCLRPTPKIIGQINASQTVPCGDTRCAGTLRPPGCTCARGADAGGVGSYVMEPASDQVHAIWHTPSYALGGVEFSPNDYFSPNTQQRWTGMIFGNAHHTALGL